MLRTLAVALALGAPAYAACEEFPESAIGVVVRADDGAALGEIQAVERDARGRIVAVEIDGLEPADAPFAPGDLIAEENDEARRLARQRERSERGAGGSRASLR
jgi:hypothetical protein